MADQIHKKFSSKQVVDLLQRYEKKRLKFPILYKSYKSAEEDFLKYLKNIEKTEIIFQ